MGILQNYNEGNMDALRSVKYSETGTQAPYVVKDIKNPPQNNDNTIGLQLNTRIDDTSRIAQMLVDKPGLKFAGNQALLNASEIASKTKAAASKKRNQKGGATAAGVFLAGAAGATVAAAGQVLKIVGSTLAQVPVNGTGTHFLRGFTPDTYIKSGDPSGLLGFLGFDGVNGAARALNGKPIIIDNDGSPGNYLYPSDIKDRQSTLTEKKSHDTQNWTDESTYTKTDTELNTKVAETGGVILPDNVSPEFVPPITSYLKTSGSNTPFSDTTKNTYNSSQKIQTRKSTSETFLPPNNDYIDSPIVPYQLAKERKPIIFDNSGREGYTPIVRTSLLTTTSSLAPHFSDNTNKVSQDNSLKTLKVQDPLFGGAERDNLEDQGKPGEKNKLGSHRSFYLDYSKPTVNKETRVGLGNQGAYKKIVSYTQDNKASDKINKLGLTTVTNPEDGELVEDPNSAEARDFIKFRFEIVTPEETTFLHFRAFLTDFSDSYTGAWDTTKYLGRAEDLYTYQGFSRNIGIGFIISAATRQEMKPLYRKMAALASVTAPTYGGDGKFMRGTIARVTVGDYVYRVPGIIESVNYKWNTDYNWEIAYLNSSVDTEDIDMQELPQTMDCNLTFKPIHNFIPQAIENGEPLPYITNPTPAPGNATESVKKQFIANPV